jgi:hypothetical protein
MSPTSPQNQEASTFQIRGGLLLLEHRLTDLDEVERSAMCSVCGPTKIRSMGGGRWRCRVVANRNKGKSSGRSSRGYRRHVASSCSRCGFIPEHRTQLEVHHVDLNHDNNDVSNLSTLCANCHRLIHSEHNG